MFSAGRHEFHEAEMDELSSVIHSTIKTVTNDMETLAFNTAIACLMTLTNMLADEAGIYHNNSLNADKEPQLISCINSVVWRNGVSALLKMLAPMAPHFAAEAWMEIHGNNIFDMEWPVYKPKLCLSKTANLVIQVSPCQEFCG